MMNFELHNAVQRLIAEWRGWDATQQTRRIPELVDQIVKLKEAANEKVGRRAAHDTAEAA